MNTFNKTIVRVNEDPELIAKLRRLKVIEKDGDGEFIWAQVGGDYFVTKRSGADYQCSQFKMYLGNEVEMPSDFARKLMVGYPVPLDEPCPQCWNEKLNKSTGFTIAGMCHQCRGMKFIDLNRTANTFEIVKHVDGGDTFDPAKLPTPKKSKKELATARA